MAYNTPARKRFIRIGKRPVCGLSNMGRCRFAFFPLGAILSIFVTGFFGGSPLWSIPLFIAYSVVSICSVIALFTWRKWGFYAVCLTTVAGFLTCFVTGVLPFGVTVNCAGTFILAILLRTEWNLFR